MISYLSLEFTSYRHTKTIIKTPLSIVQHRIKNITIKYTDGENNVIKYYGL